MEKCQRSPEDMAKYRQLTEEQMERRAKVRGLLALVSTTPNGTKRMDFVNRDFITAINIRRCAVLENRPPEMTRENFVGQPLKVLLYETQLEAVVGGRSKKPRKRLHVSRRLGVQGAPVATTVHRRRRSTLERRSAVCAMRDTSWPQRLQSVTWRTVRQRFRVWLSTACSRSSTGGGGAFAEHPHDVGTGGSVNGSVTTNRDLDSASTEAGATDQIVASGLASVLGVGERTYQEEVFALCGGGRARVRRQHAQGKLTARERLYLLLDRGSFQELDRLVSSRESLIASSSDPLGKRRIPGDGVVSGFGRIHGRPVFVYSQDFTVAGGSLSEANAAKICKVIDKAIEVGAPVVALCDSGGARIQEGVRSLAGYAEVFKRNVLASGYIPQLSLILGPCAGGAVYSPALTDFVLMSRRHARMFVTGPSVTNAALGEQTTDEALGGAAVHCRISGVAHLDADDDIAVIQLARELLSYLPQNARVPAPQVVVTEDPSDREEPVLDRLVPSDAHTPYDMRDVLMRLVDDEELLEIQTDFAPNMLTAFARLNGRSVALIANQPLCIAGAIDSDAAVKAARFVRFADAFGIPIVTLVDVPGFLPGTQQEHGGIIRHGSKLLYAYTEATVPKLTIILRKAYGGAYCVMASKHLRGDLNATWPCAHIAVMGRAAASQILRRRVASTDALETSGDTEASEESSVSVALQRGYVDAVVRPRLTRRWLIHGLSLLASKETAALREPWPPKKHGNIPL